MFLLSQDKALDCVVEEQCMREADAVAISRAMIGALDDDALLKQRFETGIGSVLQTRDDQGALGDHVLNDHSEANLELIAILQLQNSMLPIQIEKTNFRINMPQRFDPRAGVQDACRQR